MQFRVVKDPLVPATPEPVTELTIRVIDDQACLCARPRGHSAWTYLLVLGYSDGVRLFTCTEGLGLPVEVADGALKMSDIRACVTGLPS